MQLLTEKKAEAAPRKPSSGTSSVLNDLKKDKKFSQYVRLSQKSGQTQLFRTSGRVKTVIAPTNEALKALPAEYLEQLKHDKAALAKFIRSGVANRRLGLSKIVQGGKWSSVDKENFSALQTPYGVMIDGATIAKAGRPGPKSVIHQVKFPLLREPVFVPYSSVSVLPGAPFTPVPLTLNDKDPFSKLPPGDYEIPVSLTGQGIPGRLVGGPAYLIATLRARAFLAKADSQMTQIITEKMYRRVNYDAFTPDEQKFLESYLPEYPKFKSNITLTSSPNNPNQTTPNVNQEAWAQLGSSLFLRTIERDGQHYIQLRVVAGTTSPSEQASSADALETVRRPILKLSELPWVPAITEEGVGVGTAAGVVSGTVAGVVVGVLIPNTIDEPEFDPESDRGNDQDIDDELPDPCYNPPNRKRKFEPIPPESDPNGTLRQRGFCIGPPRNTTDNGASFEMAMREYCSTMALPQGKSLWCRSKECRAADGAQGDGVEFDGVATGKTILGESFTILLDAKGWTNPVMKESESGSGIQELDSQSKPNRERTNDALKQVLRQRTAHLQIAWIFPTTEIARQWITLMDLMANETTSVVPSGFLVTSTYLPDEFIGIDSCKIIKSGCYGENC